MFRLQISHKLMLALLGFALPLVFTLTAIVSEANIAIDFASKEVIGAMDLGVIAPVQGALARAALHGDGPDKAGAHKIAVLDGTARGLDIGAQQAAFVSAADAPGDKAAALSAARAKLRDLITRVGDRSNLILDNVLVTY